MSRGMNSTAARRGAGRAGRVMAGALMVMLAAVVPVAAQTPSGAVPAARWGQELPAATIQQSIGAVQQRLKDYGCYRGRVDAKLGPATRKAIRLWQRTEGAPQNGLYSEPLVQGVLAGAPRNCR